MTDILSFLLMPFPFSLKKFLQYFRAELLAMNTLGVPSLTMPFFCLHYWKRYFHAISSSWSIAFLFLQVKVYFPCLLAPMISDEKSTLTWLTGLLCKSCGAFFPHCFQVYFFIFAFQQFLIIMYLNLSFFELILLEIQSFLVLGLSPPTG